MSKIDKLSILGVRSFDNTRSETIQFHTPLTLIVGLNGSGKTTIIECLKYATTGEQPPNSKGGAFIHDPKLAGEKEVLAQVKLSFRSTDGIKMVATRNLQLTVKKTTRSMKSLESNVLISKGGERRSASSRTTDIDRFMSRSIGVSKAVLDNVIFCHQDESLWPLSTPADLKKRFDELFDAIKYTKAIENIKILAKNQRTALIGFKKDAEKYKVDKQRGERAFAQANELSDQINEMKQQHTELSTKISEASERSDEAFRKADRAGVTVGQLNGKRIEERTKQESVDSLRINLQELQETDEELAAMLSQYEKQVGDYQRDFNSAKERYSELAEEIEKVRGKVSNKERECGTYEAQKQSYDAKVVSREKLIKETAHSHAIRGYDWDINDERASEFMQLIKKMAREQTAKFDRVRQENREELQVEQKKLNELAEKKSALNSSKESSRQAIASYDRKLSSLQTQLNKTTIDEGGKAALESERNDVQSRLSNFKSENEAAKHSERIKDLDSRIRQLEDQRERLDEEMAEASRQAKESAELDYVQGKLKQQRESLETMEGAHRDKIGDLLGADWDRKTLESRYQSLLSERSSAVNEAEKRLEGVTRESEQAQRQVTDTRKAVELKESKMKAAAKKVRETTSYEPSEYENELDLCNQQRDIWVKDVTANKQLMEYFDACISMAEKQRKCRTCCRDLQGQKDVDVLLKEMKKQKNEQDLSNVKKDLEDLEKEIQGFKNVRPSFDEWKNLGQELPTLKSEHTTLQRKYDEITKRLEGLDLQSQERREALRAVESISRAVQSITASVSDIATFERQVKDLTAKQKDAGLSRGTDAVQKDQKKVNEEVRTLKTELAKATSDRDRGSKKINALQLQLSEADKKLSQAEWQLKEKKSLQDQMAETSTLANEQREQMKARDEEIQTLVPLQSQAKARYDDAAHRGAEKDRQLQTEVNKINSSLNELKVANEEIMAYIDRDGPKQVERGRAQLAELKSELENWQKEQQKNVRAVKELEEKLRDHDTTKRSIADNQRFRRDLKALEQVREEIAELESRDAEEEQARFSREGQKAHQERQGFMSKQATLAGQMSSKDEEMQRVLAAWDVDFKDAAKNYKEAHIRAETCKACIEDLGRYSGALDKAVLKYHTLKMEEINRIIDELWRETYQGTDVDTIMIRSESENEKSNKSYNYRVCMMKQDTEMDMRGRCSAGQKVLACIIIRLALAECFGVNCGIIALDEPTTNLDTHNIAALAKALGKIIQVRKAQKNFQLIVITHDEDFLRYMNCSDHTEWYYRVGRNDRQKSEIVKQSIAEVM